MTVIGLTGGIASGKSTAASWMKDLGAVVIDADRLGHRVYEPGTSGFQAVVNEFGHDLVQADGTINRQLLGGRVFGDPDQMKRLTDIVWPEIRRLANQEVAELKRREPNTAIVLEAAVLVEANWFDLVDEVWVVTVEPAVARGRLMARNSLTEAQAQARIDSQLTNKERALHAFVKIDNSGTLDEFHQLVDKEWRKLAKRAGFTVAAPVAAAPAPTTSKKAVAAKSTASKSPAAKAAPAKAAPAKAGTASKATTAPKAAAKPAAKAPATVASKAASTKVSATKAAAPKVAAKPAASKAKAAPVKASAAKAAPAGATATRTRSASTQSASTRTRTSTARPAVARATTTRTVATRRVATTATRPAAKASAATTSTRRTTVKPVAAKPAPRPVAGRRAGAK